MKFSQVWCMIVALLVVFAVTVSFLSAQTEEPSAVNAPSSAAVQSDSVEVQSSSDKPEQKQPTLAPSRGMAAAADVETERRFNELRHELLDAREKMVDWWLEATAIFLTLVGVAAALLGYFGFKRLDRIESEAREYMKVSEEHAQAAQRYKEEAQLNLEDTRVSRDESQSITERLKAEFADNDSYKAADEDEKNDQQELDPSLDRAVSAAISLEQQNKIEEAIRKWRSIANIAEGTNNELAARAWFFVGYLMSPEKTPSDNFEEAINAYSKAIDLNLSGPNLPCAYYNRGNARASLGQIGAAIDDYDTAIGLNPSDPIAYFNRGNARASLGQIGAAIDDYDTAIGLNPSYASAYFNRGGAKAQLNRIDEARQDCEMALDAARAEGNADVIARAVRILEILDKGDAP